MIKNLGKLLLTIIILTLIYNFCLIVWDAFVDLLNERKIRPLGVGQSLFMTLISVAIIHPILFGYYHFYKKTSYRAMFGKASFKLWNLGTLIAAMLFVFGDLPFLFFFEFEINNNITLNDWIKILIPMLLAILLQSSAEEIFVHGFFQTEITKLNISLKWIIFIPAFIWASGHFRFMDTLSLKLSFIGFLLMIGLINGYLYWRLDSILPAVSIHFGLNAFTMLIYGNSLKPANSLIWQADFSSLDTSALNTYYLMMMLIAFVIFLLVTRWLGFDKV